MTKRTNNNLQTEGQTIHWPKGQTTIYKQDRQYNDQKDKQQSTNRTENTMTKRTNTIYKQKDRQHNGQKKKYKRTNNDLQNIHIKLKIE